MSLRSRAVIAIIFLVCTAGAAYFRWPTPLAVLAGGLCLVLLAPISGVIAFDLILDINARSVKVQRLLERCANLDDVVEFYYNQWSILVILVLFVYFAYSIIDPAYMMPVLRWWPICASLSLYFLYGILRISRWSPYCSGPILTLTSGGIAGPGGWPQEPWSLKWGEFDHARYCPKGFGYTPPGLAVYKKGFKDWELPYLQLGPFDVFGGVLVRCIDTRYKAYVEWQAAALANQG